MKAGDPTQCEERDKKKNIKNMKRNVLPVVEVVRGRVRL